MRRVGEILLERGLVSRRDLDEALAAQRELGGFLAPTLVRLGAVSEDDLIAVLSDELGVPILPAAALPAPEAVREAAARVRAPVAWLMEKEAAPWFETDESGQERLCIASRHAYDAAVQEAAEQWHIEPARLFFASSQALEPLLMELSSEMHEAAAGSDPSRLRELAEEAPVIDFVNAVLADALANGASDVHFEPFENRMLVRFRIDGVLRSQRETPRAMFDAVASRIKLLSGMDIAERRLPQDGRQSMRISGRDMDVRVSTLPTTWGESVVLRFLGKMQGLPDFAGLGMAADHIAMVRRLMEKPNGVVLVTGPTGSGKTTTVYRLLSQLNDGVKKIVTVEDPVEMDIPGLMQMHVRADIGLSFAAGLRSILRQDPDVIMVGEIRDSETAKIAVQAALTGQLVIATVHTNSALMAVARLIDLGVEEFLLADVLRGVMGQRLVRRTCSACGVDAVAREDEAHASEHLPPSLREGPSRWRVGHGCARCNQSGLEGRTGVFEVVEIDAALSAAIRRRASEDELTALVAPRGFRTMYQDALMKARAGETSLREARRVLAP